MVDASSHSERVRERGPPVTRTNIRRRETEIKLKFLFNLGMEMPVHGHTDPIQPVLQIGSAY